MEWDVPDIDENDVELIDINKDKPGEMVLTEPKISMAPSMIAMQKPLSLDEHAEAEGLAGKLGLPSTLIGTDIARYRKMAQAQDVDISTADSPVFRDWMDRDEQHLSVGMQDSQNLVDFEKIMMAGPDGLGRTAMQPKFDEKTTITGREGLAYSKVEDIRNEPTGPSVMLDFDETTGEYREPNKWEKQVAQADKAKRLAEANTELRDAREASGDWLWSDSFGARPYRQLKKGAIDLKASFWGALQGVDEAFADLTRAIPGLSEFFQSGANYAAQQFTEGKTLAESITEKDKGGTLQQVSDAVFENLPQMLVTMGFSLVGMAMGGARGVAAASPKVAAALLGRQQAAYAAKAGASSMGAMIYGETYGSAREAGSSALQANLGAVPNALIQGALENIGLGKIFQAWRSTGAMSYIKNTLTAALTEGVTEWIQQFPDDFFHMVSLIGSREGPDGYAQGMSEFVQGLPNTIEGANMGAAVGAIYGMLFALPGLRGQARRERLMANDKLFFDALNDSAQSSALREKLPGMYQDIVSRVTENGPVQNVYVSAEDLTAAAISLDQDVYELAESIGVSRQELDHAAGLGADVEIPLALYQSKVAGTEAGLKLSGKVKTTADGMTLEEMATERNRTVASVVNALREIQNNQQMDADLDEALADIRQGLLDAGHSESQADANLVLLKARAKIAAATWSAIKGQQVTPAQWVRDYAGVSLKTEEAEEQSGNALQQFLGEKGAAALDNAEEATTRMDNLVVAREMETAGKDAKTIKMATGWERGTDGKWRYEISDVNLSAGALYDTRMRRGPSALRLKNIVTGGESLFAAYPELGDIFVEDNSATMARSGTLGNYSSQRGSIDLNVENFLKVSGFETDSYWYNRYIEDLNSVLENKKINRALLQDTLPQNLFEALFEGETPRYHTNRKGVEKALADIRDEADRYEREGLPSAVERARSTLIHEIQHAIQEREGFAGGGNVEEAGSFERYRALAGETESRNVQSRMGMTDEERRSSLASETEDVKREDQIMLDDVSDADRAFLEAPQRAMEELESNLEVMDEEIDEILSRDTAGPEVEDPVSLSSKLYQVQDIPEWRELTAAWMRAHNYTQEQIDARLAAMEGQVKLQAALADKISAVMVGAGIAARKTAGGYTTSGPVRTNIDPIYRLSFDLSSQCVKRLSSARTVNRVQKELGRPLTVGEQLALIALYRYEGLLAPCLYCYVESNRRKATETVGSSREVVVNGNIPEAWSDVRKKLAAAAIKEFKEKGMTRDDIHFEYIVDEVASFTPEAEEWKRKYPKVANFLQKEADATKQNKAKPYEEYVADLLGDWVRDKDGNIKFSKTGKKSFRDNFSPEKVKELNGFAGLRFFSTSDFQIEHFVDLLQAFWDMQLLGLKSHAYTKVEDYVKIFGGSRQKINLSCFAKEDENGNIVADTDQGWDWEKAKEYRAKHPDVGIIIVTGNDKILDWAMKQDWIDYCIPFHYSGLSSDVYQSQGWQDSTSTQMEEGFDAKPVVGVPKEQANDIAERLASGEITEQEASVEYAKILFENDSYGGKMEALFMPETLPENTGTAGSMRNAAKKKWLAMVESGTFDATDINPQYFTIRRKSEKAKDAAINPVEVHHVRMYEMGTQDGITDAQGVHNYLKICAQERLIPVFPNFMWKDRKIAETNEERTAMVREAKQRWKAIVEDPKYGGHWEGTEKDKKWVLSDEGWNQMWADIQDQIDPAFFKVKKDYARTDTPFEVVDPEGIDVGAAQKLLAEAFDAEGGLEQKYAENKSIGDKLMEMIAAAKRTYEEDLAKTPGKTQAQKEKILSNKIGIDALKAVRFGVDPWAEKTGNEDRQLPSKREAQELRPYSEVQAEQQAQQRPSTLNQEGLTPAAQTLLQRAFHGSPHKFTQFMLEHIGSGEGGQAHGWGLYFAQNRNVSERYRESLSDVRSTYKIGTHTYHLNEGRYRWLDENENEIKQRHISLALHQYRSNSFDKEKAIAFLREKGAEWAQSEHKATRQEAKQFERAAKFLETHNVEVDVPGGQLYEVEIPDNDVLLDEQLYFDQQPEKVQSALKKLGQKEGTRRVVELGGEKYIHTPGSPFGNWLKDDSRGKLSDDIKQRLDQSLDRIVEEKYTYNIFNNNDSGREIYEKLVRETGSPEAASRALNEAGIKGISYDGRQDGRSFVVFDDKAVQMIDTFYQLQQEQTRPGARGQIEFVGDNEAIITLFKGAADLSTFAHESAHLFMRDLERMAMSSNAPQEIVDDYLALKRWAAPQIEGWYNAHLKGRFGGKAYADLTAEERDAADYVAEQELLAEGFLTYLKEGKAPSQELRSVFGRFRDWLTSIYRAIMGQGFTPVNDEVRAVFDRMLASQQDVAEMEQVHAATDAERAEIDRVGADMLTENERKRLEDARRKAKARASEKTLLDRLKAYFAATGEKKKIEAQARAEVDAQPVNAAVNDALAAGGISYDSVVEQYGEETAKALAKKRPTLLRKEGGVDISQAAATQDMNPDDLVTGILNAPKKEDAVKAVTDRMLAEREEEIRQEMQEGQDLQPGEEGYYSDDQLSALLIEATALARKAGRKVRTTGNAEANRAWARGILNRMTLSEASVHRLSAAEAKQAAKAAQLLAEGKVEEAADAKRRQAILHAMVLEAVAFRKKLDGFTRKMKRWDHRKVKDQDAWAYQEQLRALAQRYRIGGRDRFAPDRPQELSRLRDFLKAHDDEDSVFGEAPWSEWLLNEEVPEENGRLKLTVEQYEEIMALGQHLAEGMDPGEAKVISEGLEGTVAELVDKASTTLENSGNKFTYREEGTLARKGQDLWKSLFAGLDNAQYVLMAADGYEEIGKHSDKQGIHSYLFRLMKEAIGRYGQRYRNALPELQELAVVRENFAKRFEKTYGKRAESINGVATPEAMREVGRPRWTAEHIWCIARNMGNEGNLKTLREGYGLSDEDLINLTSILTREEWQAIQRECELVGASYDETDAVFRKIYGVPMPSTVMPDPITVTCADGTQLDLPGWYFPIAVDTQISPDIGDKQEISAIRDNPDFTALGPAIRRGHTHARTGTGKACALRYEVFESALWDQWRFIEMGPIVKDLDRLTRNKKWRKAFTDAFGPQYYKELREWLKYAARPTQPKKDVIAKLESSLRAKATIFAMGLNVNTFVRQFGGYPQALPDVGFKYLLKGLSYAAMHPIAMWRQINEMSPMMADRDKNFVRELRSHIMKMQKAGVEIGGRKYTSEDVSQAAMSLVTLGDRMTTYPIWQGAYLKAMDKGMSQKDAIAYADGVVSKTQAVAGEADINAWQRDQTGIKRLFTMFMSETLRKGSRMRYWFHAMTHGKISVAEYCGHVAAETFGVTMLYLAMRALLSSSEPDPEDVLMALFDEVTGPLPFVNQISGSIQYGRSVGQLSSMKGVDLGVSLIGKTWKWAHKPTDSDAIEGMFKAAVDLTAFELGVGNARRIYRQAAEGWDDISRGKSVNPFRMFIRGFDK